MTTTMKKAAESLMTVIAAVLLCVILMPQTARAESAHTHCICGGSVSAGDHTSHTDVSFQPWDGTSAITYDDSNTAYVYLTDSATMTSNLEITGGKTLYLCLNGRTFGNGSNKIVVKENSRLVLCDCAGGGTIRGVTKGWGGGAVYLYNSRMDMYGGKLTGGSVKNGGAIALDDKNCVFNMYGGEISGNKASAAGGAIYLNGSANPNVTDNPKASGTVNLYGGTISGNSSVHGGAIYLNAEGTLNIYGGTISGNTGTIGTNGYGGAIYLNSGGAVNMSGGTISGNTTYKDGGAILLYDAAFRFSGGTISGNKAGRYGGAVYLDNYAQMEMTGGEISGNEANEEGGAVHVYGKNASLTLSGGTISGNKARDGGAVYLNQELSTLNVTGGEISGNTAGRYGGAVYLFRGSSTLNLSGGTIQNNTAGSSGGAVYFNTTSNNEVQGIVNLSGNPVVSGNTISGKANNIAVKTGKTLSITGAMTEGASIGITTESTAYPVVFTNEYAANYESFFIADDTNAHVHYDSAKKLAVAATNWGEPAYTWSEDHSTVTAKRVCGSDNSHVEEETVSASATSETAATCITQGKKVYTSADFRNRAFVTQTYEETFPIDPNAHDLEKIAEVPATYETAGTEEYWKCRRCGKLFSDAAGQKEIPEPVSIPKLEPASVAITFDAGSGASVTPVSVNTNEQGKLSELPTASRTGYTFKGWYTAADGGEPVTTDTVFTEAKTIYAHWEKNAASSCTITFKANGGSGADTTQTVTAGEAATLTKNTFTRTGCTFTGWAAAADGTGTFYTDGQSVTLTADMTLYAQWKENTTPAPNPTPDPTSGGGGTTTPTVNKATATKTVNDATTSALSTVSDSTLSGAVKNLAASLIDAAKADADNAIASAKSAADANTAAANGKAAIQEITDRVAKAEAITDVPASGDEKAAVQYGIVKGYIKGTSDRTFDPAGNVTRAQFVAFLYRLAGSTPVTTANEFTDVTPTSSLGGSDFYDAINWAVANHIAFGYGDGTFRPFQTVTRAEALAFLNRYKGGSSSAIAPYTDVDQEAWYAKDVNWAYGTGITVGKSETIFGTHDNTTRGEAVQFIYRAEKVK